MGTRMMRIGQIFADYSWGYPLPGCKRLAQRCDALANGIVVAHYSGKSAPHLNAYPGFVGG